MVCGDVPNIAFDPKILAQSISFELDTTLQQQRKRTQQPRSQKASTPPPKGNRLSVAFLVVSSLVICSLLAAGLVTAVSFDIFGSDDDDPSTNIEDPNSDLVNVQETKVAENPDDYEALVLLANVLGNSNRLDEAIPIYEKALQQRPDDAATRLDFARALSDGGKLADAEVQFEKVIQLDPNNQAGVYYLAELYRTSTPARTDEAIPLYQRAVAIDSQSFIGEQSANQLIALGAGSPLASPSSSPQSEATP